MKSTILAILILCSTPVANANLTLTCSGPGYEERPDDFTLGVVRKADSITCSDQKGFNYDLKIVGAGLGLAYTSHNEFVVECPLVRRKKAQEKGLKLAGPSLSASFLLGATAGFVAGSRGTACIVLGANILAVGASATFDYIRIEPRLN